MAPKVLAVIGSIVYDLFMITSRVPDAGETLKAQDYHERMGGKGANASVAAYRSSRKKPPLKPLSESTEATTGAEILIAPIPPIVEDVTTTTKAESTQDEAEDIHVTLVGAVGDDEYGKIMRKSLTNNGVDTAGVVTMKGYPSTLGFVLVESFSGENRCLFHEGAMKGWEKSHFLKVSDLAHGLIPDLMVLQMSIRKEVVEQIIETAGEAGIDILLNAAPADPITNRTYKYLTHLVINETEAAILSGREVDEVHGGTWEQICKEFLGRGAKNVIITLGGQGAYFATGTESGLVPAYKVDVVDTTGAGSVSNAKVYGGD